MLAKDTLFRRLVGELVPPLLPPAWARALRGELGAEESRTRLLAVDFEPEEVVDVELKTALSPSRSVSEPERTWAGSGMECLWLREDDREGGDALPSLLEAILSSCYERLPGLISRRKRQEMNEKVRTSLFRWARLRAR